MNQGFRIEGKHTHADVYAEYIEPSCIGQIQTMVDHEAFTGPVAIMPDAHAGDGAVIGFTMSLGKKVIPNVVGVDIGCGMLAADITPLIAEDPDQAQLAEYDRLIRKAVPMGFQVHQRPVIDASKRNIWPSPYLMALAFQDAYYQRYKEKIEVQRYSREWFLECCLRVEMSLDRVSCSIGTLGGGNHFIELARSQSDEPEYWIVIHSGSRQFGLKVAEYWQAAASGSVKISPGQYKEMVREIVETTSDRKDIPRRIKKLRDALGMDKKKSAWKDDLAYLEGKQAHGYLLDMIFAQEYARLNRYTILGEILAALGGNMHHVRAEFDTVHNYIDFRDLIIRKGAIKAMEGKRMLIPLNMRDGSLVCLGRSNPAWNYSAPHGAGRIMSRNEARRKLDLEEYKEQMRGVFSSSIGPATIDEAPGAYKEPHAIIDGIEPTAEIIDRLQPILNIKADDEPKRRKKNATTGKEKDPELRALRATSG